VDEDLNSFYDFAHSDKILSRVVKDLFGMRAGRLDDVFGRVILATTLQMAPLARSMQTMGNVLELFGTKISFDNKNVVLWPRPSDITQVAPKDLQASAKLGYRAARLSKAAAFLEYHPLSHKELDSLSEEDAIKKLLEIPGVGKYSAGIILGRSSAPLDVWSVVVMSELLLKKTPEKPRDEIDEVTNVMEKRWGKWAWMAFVYIVNDLNELSKIYHISRLS
jgi:DNA-3-methyladenine glycosylase II